MEEPMRSISLRKITFDNIGAICKLQVGEAQKDFVARNVSSLAEAYVAITNGGVALPFGIYAGEEPIGFVMIGYDTIDQADPPIAARNYCVWRFMIAEAHQRQGYGREAMKQTLDYIRGFPAGKAERCWLSYEPENEAAKRLYESFGFRENGEICDGELVSVLEL